MAKPSRGKSGRGGDPGKSNTSSRAKPSKSVSPRGNKKLDRVTDAPESGEPREQGRSRGRVIESRDKMGIIRKGQSPAQGSIGGRDRSGTNDPRARQRADESGNTANEAWEAGRHKAMR